MNPRARLLAFLAVTCLIAGPSLAQNPADSPTIPKRLAAPRLNGRCDDDAYADALRLPIGRSAVRLVHNGIELFACLDSLPPAARSVSLWIDPEGDRRESSRQQHGLGPAQMVVRVWPDGRVVARQGNPSESGALTELPVEQFRAAPARADRFWTGEVAIPLAWLGGAGGATALRVSLDGSPGETVSEWPEPSDEFRPSTWGDLTVGPRPRPGTRAGSAFVDGQGGYLTTPFVAALNGRRPVTLEAWVRVAGDACGTLLGGGYEHGYWIGICDVVRYRVPGGTWTRVGQTPLANGWHHVALTVDSAGNETLYVDGAVDLHVGWRPPGREESARAPRPARGPRARMVPADTTETDSSPSPPALLPLRIGSDPEAPEDLNYLHAYVSEIRIWSLARSPAELRRAALARLTGREPGLAALWRFESGFTDLVAGRRAGIVGFASLASLARDSSVALRPLSTAGPHGTLARRSVEPWDGRLPVVRGDTVTVDGMCRPGEYGDAARIPLEPDRKIMLRAVLTEDALYLCSGILAGRRDHSSRLTLYLARDGGGSEGAQRRTRGTDDLELTITADSTLTIHPQDGRTATRDTAEAIRMVVVGDSELDLQPDDLRPLALAWWSAEVRIPLATLRPFQLDQPRMRVAADYQAEPQPSAGAELARLAQGRWPIELDAAVPATWGAATVTREQLRPPRPADLRRRPGLDPSTEDFYAACPTGALYQYGYFTDAEDKWPLVDASTELVWVEGTITNSEISDQDAPNLHSTHDVDMDLSPRPESRWLLLNAESSTEDQVLETESGQFSPLARPIPGDRVIAYGRWIFDCGHDPKTEVHPTLVFMTDRMETRPVKPGGTVQEVRVIRIWLNSHPSAFSYTFNGSSIDIAAKLPVGLHPFASVVHADLPPTITRFGDSVSISVTPPATGKFYDEIVLGQLTPTYIVGSGKAYTVSLDKINVNDDLDSKPYPDCGTNDCGEWTLAFNLNGIGKGIWSSASVTDDDNPWTIQTSTPVAGVNLTMHASGYEDDDPFKGDDIGVSRGSFWSLGNLATLCCSTVHHFNAPGGNWQLEYHVTPGAPKLDVLPTGDHPFWADRLADEPNENYWYTPLGTLKVSPGVPATVMHDGSILEAPLVLNGVHLLGADEDDYTVTLDDFGTITAEVLNAPALTAKVLPYDSWNASLPQSLKDLIGYKSATIVVPGTGALGDAPYTLRVRALYKVLPPDWGEAADATPDGRTVDLRTPDPATEIYPGGVAPGGQWPLQPYRKLIKDWAWQHVANDVDVYTVIFPKTLAAAGQVAYSCKYNQPPALELRADDEHLVIPSMGLDSLGRMRIIGLASNFPEGKARVQVLAGPKAPRGFYRFQAKWLDRLVYSPQQCAARAEAEREMRERLGTLTALPDEPPFGISKPKPLPQGLISPELGAGSVFAILHLGDAETISLDVSTENAGAIASRAVARLYDLSGVLLAESDPGAGLGTATHLLARGLARNQQYVLQVVAPGGGAAAVTTTTW